MRVSTIILSLFPNIKKLFVHLFTPSKQEFEEKLKYKNLSLFIEWLSKDDHILVYF